MNSRWPVRIAIRTGEKTMSKRPNIIFFFSDQQRWDTVGCYGQKLPVTPNLDRMAEEGVKFEYAFTCQPVCGPARACLQTGRYATETGCYRNDIAPFKPERYLAEYFNEAGYETAYVGKWHLASTGGESSTDIGPIMDYQTKAVPPELRGGYKDFWIASDVLEFTSHGYDGYMYDKDMNKREFKGYRADCTTDFALEYLRNKTSDHPFFMTISYIEPHHQNDHNTYEGPAGSDKKFENYEVPGDLIGTGGDWKEHYPNYLGCCNSLDMNLGRLRAELARLGLSENTIILYASDHGSHFRTRNAEYKRSCHDGCIRIPMVIHGPGFMGGKVVDNLVSLMDVPPTLLACAGIEKPNQMRGNTLQKIVMGDSSDWPEEVFLQISESQVGRAIRTNKWKYSVSAPDKNGQLDASSDRYVEEYLYDLEKDPHEKNNLVQDAALMNVRGELSGILKRRMAEAGEAVPVISAGRT